MGRVFTSLANTNFFLVILYSLVPIYDKLGGHIWKVIALQDGKNLEMTWKNSGLLSTHTPILT